MNNPRSKLLFTSWVIIIREMTLTKSLKIFFKYNCALAVFFSVMNLFLFFSNQHGPLLSWIFDLRIENNIATWFSGLVILTCALSFFNLAHTSKIKDKLLKIFLHLAFLGFVFLSADEVASIHENVCIWFTDKFFLSKPLLAWVLVAAPFYLTGGAIVTYFLFKIILNLKKNRNLALSLLFISLFFVFGVVAMEYLEGVLYFKGYHLKGTIWSYLEEMMELTIFLSLLKCNIIIAEENEI
jgi:hypothetical protein